MGCPLSTRTVLPLISLCLSYHHKGKPLPLSSLPETFSLPWSAQLSSDLPLYLPWTSYSGQQILSVLFYCKASFGLPCPDWSLAVIREHCFPAVLSCGVGFPSRIIPLSQGLVGSFLIHLVTYCRFGQAENQKPLPARGEVFMWDQGIAVWGTQI